MTTITESLAQCLTGTQEEKSQLVELYHYPPENPPVFFQDKIQTTSIVLKP